MPLVVMCGFPSSGKTKRSIELKTYLEVEKKARVTVVTHHRDNVDKNHTYTGLMITVPLTTHTGLVRICDCSALFKNIYELLMICHLSLLNLNFRLPTNIFTAGLSLLLTPVV